MLCPVCNNEGNRYGKNRNGSQRFYCRECFLSFSERVTVDQEPRVFADKNLTVKMAATAISLLMEGTSIRGVCRILHIGQHTLLDLVRRLGEGCERLQRELITTLPCRSVQCDEIWSFVHCKERTRLLRAYHPEGTGDCYTWTALDRDTKLILAYTVGKRDNSTGTEFAERLWRATAGHFQINTDGLGIYRSVIPMVFGRFQNHAQVVKIFSTPAEGQARYSPPEVVGVHVAAGSGDPDLKSASTSFVERSNLSIRMMLRRFTRLTNAHSKSWDHHEAAIALLFAFYNFCRKHMTLKETPAMAAGLTDHVWSVAELIERAIPRNDSVAA